MPFDHSRVDMTMPGFITQYHVAGAGVGVIRDGKLVWTGYYGEQAPGVPANARTVFNTASVEKDHNGRDDDRTPPPKV